MNIGLYVDKDGIGENHPAMINAGEDGRVMSYGELSEQTSLMAQNLLDMGVRHGDRVMVMLTNCMELQICYFAIFKIGAIMQPLNYFISSEDILYASRQCRPKIFVTNHELFPKVAVIRESMDWVNDYYIVGEVPISGAKPFSEMFTPARRLQFPDVEEGDFGQLFFVFSKQKTKFHGTGVLLSHWVMEWHSRPYELLGLTQDDVVAGILHPYNALTRATFKAGAAYVIMPDFSGEKFLGCCDRYGISFLGGTPGMFREILHAAKARGHVPGSLRACFSVGNLLETELWKEFEDYFQTRVYGGIGCKELGIFSLEPYDTPTRYGSIGRVLPYMDSKIQGESAMGPDMESTGILSVKSNSLITHYWLHGEPVPLQTDNGWFSTGYEVTADEDGYLYLTGGMCDHSITGNKRYYNIH